MKESLDAYLYRAESSLRCGINWIEPALSELNRVGLEILIEPDRSWTFVKLEMQVSED